MRESRASFKCMCLASLLMLVGANNNKVTTKNKLINFSFWDKSDIWISKAIDTAVDRIAIGTVHGTAHDA